VSTLDTIAAGGAALDDDAVHLAVQPRLPVAAFTGQIRGAGDAGEYAVVGGVEGEHRRVAATGGRHGCGAVAQPQVSGEQVLVGEVSPRLDDPVGVPGPVHLGGELGVSAALDEERGREPITPRLLGVVVD
jgi:hypothetical protein